MKNSKYGLLACIGILFGIFLLSPALAQQQAQQQVQIPAAVKDVMLMYPGSKIFNIRNEAATDGRQVYDIDLRATNATYEQVVSFYREETRKRGWKIFNDMDRGFGYILLCHDGQFKIDVTITSEAGYILICLTIM